MLDNIMHRINQLITRYLYRQHRRKKHWNIEGSDD